MNKGQQQDKYYKFIQKHLQQKLKSPPHHINNRLQKFQNLFPQQKSQSHEMLTLKCKSLFNSRALSRELIEAVICLVMISNNHRYEYDQRLCQQILKFIFWQENQDKKSNSEIIKIFQQFNFDVSQYKVLVYQDPWYIKMFKFFESQ